jgi:hypothetical protein
MIYMALVRRRVIMNHAPTSQFDMKGTLADSILYAGDALLA